MPSMRALTLLAAAFCASITTAGPLPQAPPGAPSQVPEFPTSGAPTEPPASAPTGIPAGSPSSAPEVPPPSGIPTGPPSGNRSEPPLTPPSAPPSAAPSGSQSAPVSRLPSSQPAQPSGSAPPSTGSSGYWFADVDHSKDTVWQNTDTGYKVFRNVVTDYGAKGDGVTDDTAAINKAMSDGNRCGGLPTFQECDSSTITPAIVYFPAGKYLVSKPILMFYYTQMVGDANEPPTILASENFEGMAVVDADPYIPNGSGANWYTNQNNFFRQVRNFVIDITKWGGGLNGAGVHWQVAQATSLQNIVFELSTNAATKQQGIFMDNGSGGFFADLTFNNGYQGAFLGSQQFTSRNLTFNNCQTAIFMNWNWGWTLHGITVNGGGTGLNMTNVPTNQSVGSVVLADSRFQAVQYGVAFSYQNTSANVYPTGGTLIMDNVDMSGVATAAVVDHTGATVLEPGMIKAWASGNGYRPTTGTPQTIMKPTKQENAIVGAYKPAGLLDSTGAIFAKTRPQYETTPVSSIISAKANGCAGDGTTDDTDAINALLMKVAGTNSVAYFEHGAYLVKNTIQVPPNVIMTGEVWSLIVADSASFSDMSAPKPVFQVGKAGGQQGYLQISDFVFETNGPAPGAIMIEWNLQSQQGTSGMWDCHVRIGGSAGTNLEQPQCAAVNGTTSVNPNCEGVFLMFHATKPSSGVYLENTWFWVADHNLDVDAPKQLTIYSGRGMLINSQGPVWLWGTASEHSIMYNYQFDGVQALFSGFMQSETPYMQPMPTAPTPFKFNANYDDPQFSVCTGSSSAYCKEAWGLRIVNSKGVVIYGTGLYSFFQDYQQTCLDSRDCQDNMIHLQNSQVNMYAVNTFASVNMLVDDTYGIVRNNDNPNWWCATLSYYFTGR